MSRISSVISKTFRILTESGITGLIDAAYRKLEATRRARAYQKWIMRYGELTDSDRIAIRGSIQRFSDPPLISILMPVFDVDEQYLRNALDSVRAQLYENWELCIADDRSTKPHIRTVLDEYTALDDRIRVEYRKVNGHISAASNTALAMSNGEFIALMDHDDVLTEDALFQVADLIIKEPETDLIYSDEDKIDGNGLRFDPLFKPDWSPDLMRSGNLVTHLCVFRASIIREIDGFRVGYEGSQDYDLALRFVERTQPHKIKHIPHVLYHWRAIPGSVALNADAKLYAFDQARRAITDHCGRIGIPAHAAEGKSGFHRTIFEPPTSTSVTIIVGPAMFNDRLIESVDLGSIAKNVEVILSTDDKFNRTLSLPREGRSRFEWLNAAVDRATGNVLVFLDPSTVELSENWLVELVGRTINQSTGPVGGKIVDISGRLIHAGYILGVGSEIGRPYHGRIESRLPHFFRLTCDQNFSAVSARCMAVRRDLFVDCGGFDAVAFPENYADIDLCLRLGHSGFRTVWTSQVTSIQVAADLVQESEELAELKRRWVSDFERDPYYNPNLTVESEDYWFGFPPQITRSPSPADPDV